MQPAPSAPSARSVVVVAARTAVPTSRPRITSPVPAPLAVHPCSSDRPARFPYRVGRPPRPRLPVCPHPRTLSGSTSVVGEEDRALSHRGGERGPDRGRVHRPGRRRSWFGRLGWWQRWRDRGGRAGRDRTANRLFTARSLPPIVDAPPCDVADGAATAQDELSTAQDGAVDARSTATGPPRATPTARVHRDRLDRRVTPLELSPTEALKLAEEGRSGLARRDLPPA